MVTNVHKTALKYVQSCNLAAKAVAGISVLTIKRLSHSDELARSRGGQPTTKKAPSSVLFHDNNMVKLTPRRVNFNLSFKAQQTKSKKHNYNFSISK